MTALHPANDGVGNTYALPVALAVASMLAACCLSLRPAGSGPVALVYPPWWSAGDVLLAASASGAVIRFGAVPFVVVVSPAAAGLRGAGAWLVINPLAAEGCGAR